MTAKRPDDHTASPRHNELLRADEVAARLKVSKAQAYAMMARNELPVVRFGRNVRVSSAALDQWIEARLQGG